VFFFQVSQFSSVLGSLGVVQGDRVLIYMPMIPEAIVAMLACARIGAVHSLVFGGFASKELATRINHAQVDAAAGQLQPAYTYRVAQKISHYHESSLNRIKTRQEHNKSVFNILCVT